MRIALAAVLAALVAIISACDNEGGVDAKQSKETERLVREADKQVGMPGIANFTERKFARQILELRDTEGLKTWTYIVNRDGKLILLTPSLGYGLPYAVQFTNPFRDEWFNGASLGVPQPDPNGLFMPDALSATWVLAATKEGAKPMYVEPEIIVSPFKLH